VKGAWWERISQLKGSALSYFTIYPDATGGTVTLDGTGYGLDGETAARWKSEMVRLYPSERTIAYLWRGSHPLPGRAQFRFHGYGTMEFDPPEGSSPVFSRGKGTFWDVNEAEPGDTVSKAIELRRVVDMGSVAVMTAGAAGERRELVRKTLDAW
jgi:hypothetical protein